MSEQLISPTEVERRTSLSRSEIDRLEAKGEFPQSVRRVPEPKPAEARMGHNKPPEAMKVERTTEKPKRTRKFWIESEVDAWIEDLIVKWRTQQGVEVAPEVRDGFAERAVARDKEHRRRARHRIEPTA